MTALVVNAGLPGVAVGAVVAAPIGLTFDIATLLFVADLVGSPGRTQKPDGGPYER